MLKFNILLLITYFNTKNIIFTIQAVNDGNLNIIGGETTILIKMVQIPFGPGKYNDVIKLMLF